MAQRRLHLTRRHVANVSYQYLGAYRLRVDVDDPSGSGADPNVFLYLRHPPEPESGTVVDEFQAVASPADLAQYPVGAPLPTQTYPFFRLSYVELDLRSAALAKEVWDTIVREVCGLLAALAKLEELEVAEEVWCGGPPPESSSSSTSASTSASASASGSSSASI